MSQKTLLGTSGISVNSIGLGCMGMSDFYGNSNDLESLQVLEKALEIGIDYYDTADTYGFGRNEQLLSNFIKNKRNRIKIGTKFGIVREEGKYERSINNNPAYIKSSLEKSLKNLGTDYIDIYFVHRFDINANLTDTMQTLLKLKEEGKILTVGVSELSPESIEIAHKICPIDVLQTEYSLMTRDIEAKILPLCKKLGITFMAYSPLSRGLLSGNIESKNDFDTNDLRRQLPRFSDDSFKQNAKLIKVLQLMSEKYKCTQSQISMAWLLAQYDKMILIPGTRKISRLIENYNTKNVNLEETDLKLLSNTFKPIDVAGERYTDGGMIGINV